MTKSSLSAKYRSLMVRNSHKKTIVVLAHKILQLIFLILVRRVPYIDPHIDCAAFIAKVSAKKNAPRWIKQLKAIGRWPEPKPAAASA